MTAIERAFSRAIITLNDNEILEAARAFVRGRPVRFPADADLRCRSKPGLLLALPDLSRARPPREIIGQHIDRDRGQAHHDPDPEDRGMMDPSPVASGVLRLHSVTSWVGIGPCQGGQIVGSTENRSPACRRFSMSGLPASSCTPRPAPMTARAGTPRSCPQRHPRARQTPPRRCRRGDCAPSLRDRAPSPRCSTQAR